MAENLVYISNYCFTTDKLCELETRICRALQFRLHRITPYHFVVLYLRASRACPVAMTTLQPHLRSSFDDDNDDGNPNTMLSMTLYLIELCRSSHAMSEKPPSLLAAAAVYLARATLGVCNVEANHATIVDSSSLGKSYWTRTLAYYTGYDLDEMIETIGQLHRLHRSAERAPATGSPVPAFTKYQAAAHHRVSLKTVRLAEDLGIF
jgi:Cyclin, C-terminal domain